VPAAGSALHRPVSSPSSHCKACGRCTGGALQCLWVLVDAGCNQGWAPVPSLYCDRGSRRCRAEGHLRRYPLLLIPTAAHRAGERRLLRPTSPITRRPWGAARPRDPGLRPVDVPPTRCAWRNQFALGPSQTTHIHIDFVGRRCAMRSASGCAKGAMRPASSCSAIPIGSLTRPRCRSRPRFSGPVAEDTPQQRETNTIGVSAMRLGGFYLLFRARGLARARSRPRRGDPRAPTLHPLNADRKSARTGGSDEHEQLGTNPRPLLRVIFTVGQDRGDRVMPKVRPDGRAGIQAAGISRSTCAIRPGSESPSATGNRPSHRGLEGAGGSTCWRSNVASASGIGVRKCASPGSSAPTQTRASS